jgi:RNA recognition motif-containing protein
MNIYVSNLGFNMQNEDLKSLFTAFGSVNSSRIIMDKLTSRSKGFGFVDMPDNTAALQAIRDLNGSMQDGRPIKVSEAKPREERR